MAQENPPSGKSEEGLELRAKDGLTGEPFAPSPFPDIFLLDWKPGSDGERNEPKFLG
jgi:hypothetical protein